MIKHLQSNEGYNVYLLPVKVKGETKTVVIADFTTCVISLQNYDLNKIVIQEDWVNVFNQTILETNDVNDLALYLNEKDIKSVQELLIEQDLV